MPDNEAADIDAIIAGTSRPKPRNVVPRGKLAAPASDELDDEDLANVRKLAAATEAQNRARGTKERAIGDEPAWTQVWDSVQEHGRPHAAALEGVGNFLTANFADEANANSLEGAVQRPPGEPGREYAAGSQFDDNLQTLEAERLERGEADPLSSLGGEVGGGILQGATALGAAPLAPLLVAADYMGQGKGNFNERAGQAWDMVQEHPVLTGLAALGPLAVKGVGKAKAGRAKELRKLQNENTVEAYTNARERAAIRAQQGPDGLAKRGAEVRERGLDKPRSLTDRIFGSKPQTFLDNAQELSEKAGPGMGAAQKDIIARGDPGIDVGATEKQLKDRAAGIRERGDSAVDSHAAFIEAQAKALQKNQIKRAANDEERALFESLLNKPEAPVAPVTPTPLEQPPLPLSPWFEGPWTAGEGAMPPPSASPPIAPVKPLPLEQPIEPLSPWFEGPMTAGEPGVHPTAAQRSAHTKLTNKAAKAGEPLPPPLEERATVPPQGPGPEPPEGQVLQHKEAVKEQKGQYKKDTAAQERQYKQEVKAHKTAQKEYEALVAKHKAAAETKGPPQGPGPEPPEGHVLQYQDALKEQTGQYKSNVRAQERQYRRGVKEYNTKQKEYEALLTKHNEEVAKGPGDVATGITPFSKALPDLQYSRDQIDWNRKDPTAVMQEHERRLQVASQLKELEGGLKQAAAENAELAQPVEDFMKHKKDYGVAASVIEPATSIVDHGSGGLSLKDIGLLGLGGPKAVGAAASNKMMTGRWPSFAANIRGGQAGTLEAAATGIPKTSGALRAGTAPSPPSSEEQKAKNQTLTEKMAEFGQRWNWLEDFFPGG
jgi:hypothetical protein